MPSEKRPSRSRSPRTNPSTDGKSARAPKSGDKTFTPKTDRPASGEWSDKPKRKPMKRGEESFGNKPQGKPTNKFDREGKPAGRKPYAPKEGEERTYKPKPESRGADKRGGAGFGKEYKPKSKFGNADKPNDRKPYGQKENREDRPYGDRPRGRGDKPYAPKASGAGERVRRANATPKRGPKGRPEKDPNELSEGAKAFVKFIKEKPPRVVDEEDYAPAPKRQAKGKGPKTPPEPAKPRKEEDGMRLNKYIAHAGIAARRKADEHIAAGHVKVNGEVVREMGYKVQRTDKVEFMNKEVRPTRSHVYVLLNKPKDFVTTTDDEKGRRTVMELVEKATDERIYPVGRLDRATTGLLLFTNDGELAQKLTHPSHEVRKIYAVVLDKPLHPQDKTAIKKGVTLEDGYAQVDDIAYANEADKREVGIQIHIGKNRIVRRIFEHLGYEVVKLDRVMYAGLTKKDLPRGRWRHLEPQEVIMLKHFKG